MKLVCKCSEIIEAERIKHLLEDKGIPANITGQASYHLHLAAMVSRPLAIWVYVDEQIDDAKALVNNPEHVVYNAINIEYFYTQMEQLANQDTMHSFHWKLILLGITLTLIFLFILIFLALSVSR